MATPPMRGVTTLLLTASVLMISCAEPQGPYPTVTLRIEGTVTDADNPVVGVAGATVELRHFKGLWTNPETLRRSATGANGHYILTYSFISICAPQDNSTYWLLVSADGYDPQSTQVVPDLSTPAIYSTPVIYCTTETQVINLSLPDRQLDQPPTD